MNNLNGISVILSSVLLGLILGLLVTTGKVLTLKALGLAMLATVVIFAAAFGIYCLVEWIKEKNKKEVDGE